MSNPTFFRDGYTRKVFIKGEPNLYGDVELEIRPMLAEDRDELAVVVQKETPKRFNAVIRAVMAQHIVKWNATDDLGNAVAVTPDNIGRIPPRLYDRLYWILTGREAGDALPGATSEEADDYAARMLGKEADAKN